MNMVERVARALFDLEWRGMPDAAETWKNREMRDYWLESARTAIAAMREPTEAMVKAASIEAQRPAGWHSVYPNIYRAMISSALEGEGGE